MKDLYEMVIGLFVIIMVGGTVILTSCTQSSTQSSTPMCNTDPIKSCYKQGANPLQSTFKTSCSNYHDYYYETNTTYNGDKTIYCEKDWTAKYE